MTTASTSSTVSTAAEAGSIVTLLLPAYNEARALEATLAAIAPFAALFKEVLVVDDGSSDETSSVARAGGARVVRHNENRGYGAAIKTGVRAATTSHALIMDADGQHPVDAIPRFLDGLGEHQLVIGERRKGSSAAWLRRPGKWLLGVVANQLAGQRIPDLNCGMRLVECAFIERYFPILPEGFSLSTTLTIAALKDRASVRWVPIVTARRAGRPSNVSILSDGVNTLLLILRAIMLFDPLKIFLPVSLLTLLVGLSEALFETLRASKFQLSDAAVFCFLTAVMVFLFGLVADQLAAMRKQLK